MKRETLQAELLHTTSSANNDIDDVDGANVDEGQRGENSGSLRGNREADERSHSISKYAAQCGKCFKWRLFDTQVEFEDIRSKFIEEPFYCDRKPDVSCEDPADIEYDASRTWVIDKPNIPKTPEGFKRILIVRKDFSKLDSYYSTPTGKKCRTRNEIAQFIKENPEYEDVSLADFDFSTPKIMEETIPEHVVRKASANGSSNKRLKSIEG